MRRSPLLLALLPLALGARPIRKDAAPAPVARFDWFEYAGHDSVYRAPPARDGQYANPILSGQWTPVRENADGKILSTRVAGGFGGNFTGVVVGMYAHSAAQ